MGEDLGSQAGKVGHDTSGWLVTKGLQAHSLPCSLCVVSASLLAGGEGRRGPHWVPNPEVLPRHAHFDVCRHWFALVEPRLYNLWGHIEVRKGLPSI